MHMMVIFPGNVQYLRDGRGFVMKNKLVVFLFFLVMVSMIFSCSSQDTIRETGTLDYHGGTYNGELKEGVPHGQGTWSHTSGYLFVGEFKDGEPYKGSLKLTLGEDKAASAKAAPTEEKLNQKDEEATAQPDKDVPKSSSQEAIEKVFREKVTIENPIDVFTLFAFMNHTGYDHDNYEIGGKYIYHPVREGVKNDLVSINPSLSEPNLYSQIDARHTMVEGDFACLTGFMGEPPNFKFESTVVRAFGYYMFDFTGLDYLLTEFYRKGQIESLYKKYQPYYDEHFEEFEAEAVPVLLDVIQYFNLDLEHINGVRFIPNLLLTHWRGYMIDPNGRWAMNRPVVIMFGPEPKVGLNLINIVHEFAHVFVSPICNSDDEISRRLGAALYMKYGDAKSGYNNWITNVDESFVRAISGWATNQPPEYFGREVADGFIMTSFVYDRIGDFDGSQSFEEWVRAVMVEYIEEIS